ncbi:MULTISPECIES: cytochrome c biogenesis CcdA family protein [Brachybacterium]|uniref:Cytochrome c biogenesis CcdA family protein n=1 Tax=Brachybacterium rhamnosum TaxID=173361 RepID=A0ABW4Q1R2_9MICO|nr:cytochrome c biogenesis protein CcdA [Brachybacterium squillarum]MCW1804480.1 cytochrome c biogenesis protein CcdA [Brachybacterium squillarum]
MSGGGLAEVFQTIALDGSLVLAIAVAASAGLVAFLSPCVLPIVPGYLGYVSGLAGQRAGRPAAPPAHHDTGKRSSRGAFLRRGAGRMLAGSILFVAGFATVFMTLGGFAGAMGYLLQEHALWINRIAGILVIFMGLIFMGFLPRLSGNVRATKKQPDAGLLGAPLLGFVFGLSWTPCIGPTYAAIIALSLDPGTDGTGAARGAVLALAYSLGLGIPFVISALLLDKAIGVSKLLSRHRRLIGILSGALLISIGLLLLTGTWASWMDRLQGSIATFRPVV